MRVTFLMLFSGLLSLVLIGSAPVAGGELDLGGVVDERDPKLRRAAARELASQPDLALDALVQAALGFRPAQPAGSGVQTRRIELVVEGKTEPTSITTYVPKRVDPTRPAPALLYLHGSGGRGEEALGLWRDTADALGMILIAPTDATGEGGYGFTARERKAALAALRWARRSFNVDENRIHLTGVSRGGHMSWDIGSRYPDLWASVNPMIGGPRWLPQRGQNNIRFLENLAHLPMRDLQGEGDQKGLLLNLRYAFKKLELLKAPDAKFVTFDDLGHSFRMESVNWSEFLQGAKRDPVPPRVVRLCADPKSGERRAAWVEIVTADRTVKEAFTPKVDGRRWPSLDAMGQRAYMDSLVAKRTARIESRWTGKGEFVIKSSNVKKFRLLLTAEMFDPNKPITVTWNGRKRKKKLKLSTRVLLEEFADRFDRTFLAVASVTVP